MCSDAAMKRIDISMIAMDDDVFQYCNWISGMGAVR